MLEVETIQTIHSSLTIATVIDVSFLLQIHRYCRVNIAINRQFDVLLQPYISSPTKGSRKFKSPKMDGSLCRQKKKQVSVLAVRTDLRTRPVNGLIYIRQPHVHHHEHPQLFSNFAEQIANHLFPSSRRTFILKKHQTLGDVNA